MFGFKKREDELIKKSITIIDSETKKEEEVFDLTEVIETIEVIEPKKPIEDTRASVLVIDQELKDMAMIKELRDTYPKTEDMGKFLKDACASYKPKNELEDDITIIDQLNTGGEELAKKKLEDAKAIADAEETKRLKVEEAWQKNLDNRRVK